MSRPWWYDGYWKRRGRSPREYKTPKSRFSRRKSFLIFLLIACVSALIYTAYLLYTHRTDPLIGTIILVADIGVLIWNISILRKWRVGVRTIVAIAVVIAVLGATTGAFADIQPFSTAKSELVTWFQKAGSQPSEQPLPPASEYPADISGHVTIAEQLKQGTVIPLPPSDESEVFWIVEVTVKNNSYPEPIEASYFEGGWTAWRMTANGEIYTPRYVPSESLSIPIGETYSFMTYFVVPQGLEVGDAQMRYAGQNPYSYGNLSGGERVVAYDWDLKAVIAEPEAVVEVENWKIQLEGKSWKGSTLTVKLTITNLGSRRNFGYAGFDVGPELAVIDSTGKLVEPWVPEPNIEKGELFIFPPYTREFYPNESWSGSLKFEMSPYSGKTKLYMTRFYHVRQYFLFDLGSPAKD